MQIVRSSAALLAALCLTAQERPTSSPDASNQYSPEKEAALGRQFAAEIKRQTRSVESTDVQDYLNRLGQRLAARMPTSSSVPFTFSVIVEDLCQPTHEPAAVPGGYIFVPAALFTAGQNEAEFAGMLAHAMEHVAQRHWGSGAHTTLPTTLAVPVIFFGNPPGCLDASSSPAGIPIGFLSYAGAYTLEADTLAVQAVARAGYDPHGLLRYIERVQPKIDEPLKKTFSSLPDLDKRVANLQSAIESVSPQRSGADHPDNEFQAAQQEIARLLQRLQPPEFAPTLKRKNEP